MGADASSTSGLESSSQVPTDTAGTSTSGSLPLETCMSTSITQASQTERVALMDNVYYWAQSFSGGECFTLLRIMIPMY